MLRSRVSIVQASFSGGAQNGGLNTSHHRVISETPGTVSTPATCSPMIRNGAATSASHLSDLETIDIFPDTPQAHHVTPPSNSLVQQTQLCDASIASEVMTTQVSSPAPSNPLTTTHCPPPPPTESNLEQQQHEADVKSLLGSTEVSKHKLLIQTMLFAAVPTTVRALVTYYTSWNGYMDLKELTLIFTGLFFTSGILFSNVNADLKEAERMPADVASSLEQVEDQFVYMTKKAQEPDLTPVYSAILKFIAQWKDSLRGDGSLHDTLETLAEFPKMAADWDKRGGGGAGTVNAGVDRIRRVVMRAAVVSRTDVLPAAHGLLQFFVFASTVILFLVQYNSWVTQVCIMLCVYTVTWFNVRLISFIDDPFEEEVPFGMSFLLGTIRQVHLFPLDEYALRVLHRRSKVDTLKKRHSVASLARRISSKRRSLGGESDVARIALEILQDTDVYGTDDYVNNMFMR